MKKITLLSWIAFLLLSTGCSQLTSKNTLLTTDFQKGTALKYKFVSERNTTIDWNPTDTNSVKQQKTSKKDIDSYYEKSELVVVYNPIEIDSFGQTVIEAKIESAAIERRPEKNSFSDAFMNFAQKSCKFTISPNGKIEDTNGLAALIKEIGNTAFRKSNDSRKVKEPDMIADYIATQWFLWDSISSIPNPSKGVKIGQSWPSSLSIPATMIFKKARSVEYNLSAVNDTPNGKIAVIKSKFSPSETIPNQWPSPYEGSFQMAGKFGFLGGYQLVDLKGEGEEQYNIDKGRAEGYNQQYEMNLTAGPPFGISMVVRINVKQKLTMQLVE